MSIATNSQRDLSSHGENSTPNSAPNTWSAEWFICPKCKGKDLSLRSAEGGKQELSCGGCEARYPIESNVPVFFAEFLKSEELAEREFWEKSYDAQDDGSFKTFTDETYHKVMDLFQVPTSGLGLEYACGSGAFSDFVRKSGAAGAKAVGPKMVGLDISLSLLKSSRSVIGVQGSGELLPFQNGLFDFVLCAAALHHIPDLAKGFSEIRRVLKPGGWLYILEPNLNHPQRKLVAAATSPWRKTFSSTHFSPAENLIPGEVLTKLLNENGFTERLRTYLSPVNRTPTLVGNIQQAVSKSIAVGPLAPILESYVLIRAQLN